MEKNSELSLASFVTVIEIWFEPKTTTMITSKDPKPLFRASLLFLVNSICLPTMVPAIAADSVSSPDLTVFAEHALPLVKPRPGPRVVYRSLHATLDFPVNACRKALAQDPRAQRWEPFKTLVNGPTDNVFDLTGAAHTGQCEEWEANERWDIIVRLLAKVLNDHEAEVIDTRTGKPIDQIRVREFLDAPECTGDLREADTDVLCSSRFGSIFALPDGREIFRVFDWTMSE